MALLALMIIALQQSQFTAARYATNSQHTALALNIAQDIAKRMQLNRAAVAYLGNWQQTLGASQCANINHPCTPQQLAQHDKAEITSYSQQVLPQAKINITRCQSNFWCINIAWGGGNAATCQQAQQNSCISLRYIARL